MSEYSLARAIALLAGETWARTPSPEKAAHDALVREHGDLARPFAARIPGHALRDMTVAGASGSNYIVGTEAPAAVGYIEALQPRSVALRLGATIMPAGRGHAGIPKGTNKATTQWLADENSAITEGQPQFGEVNSTPKVLACLFDMSRQMLLQSNAEQIARTEANKAAASALDRAILQGSGVNGQPVGIVNTSVGAFTGASLNQGALRNAQADVSTADAVLDPTKVGYVATPAIAETLSTRQRFTGSDRALWEGNLVQGVIEGAPAFSTTNCPTSTMIYGDWSSIVVLEWSGGAQIAVDPFTKFNQGLVTIRLLLLVDVIVKHSGAFSVATSVT